MLLVIHYGAWAVTMIWMFCECVVPVESGVTSCQHKARLLAANISPGLGEAESGLGVPSLLSAGAANVVAVEVTGVLVSKGATGVESQVAAPAAGQPPAIVLLEPNTACTEN